MNDVGYADGFLATVEAVAELPGPCIAVNASSYDTDCTENCVACDGPGSEDCLQCDSGYVLNDEDGDGAGSCADDSESGTDGTVADCSGDGDACRDGAEQVYGCDLTCYENDGGDCDPPPTDW